MHKIIKEYLENGGFMENLALVIMAAGRGSRFGGLKQLEPVDSYGHRIIDYSVYDAARVGFDRVVFVINREIEADFRKVSDTYPEKYGISVDYAYQEIDILPDGFTCPAGRIKPWGTAHAVACLKGVVNTPFALINADDFYGREALSSIFSFLSQNRAGQAYAMVGYRLENTLSKNGKVSRGVCNIKEGFLTEICERTGIVREGDAVFCDTPSGRMMLDLTSTVSVNLWGFTQNIIDECERRFTRFLDENIASDPLCCEFYLPTVISRLIGEGSATVQVLSCEGIWQGITYRADRKGLSAFLSTLTESGEYPRGF